MKEVSCYFFYNFINFEINLKFSIFCDFLSQWNLREVTIAADLISRLDAIVLGVRTRCYKYFLCPCLCTALDAVGRPVNFSATVHGSFMKLQDRGMHL